MIFESFYCDFVDIIKSKKYMKLSNCIEYQILKILNNLKSISNPFRIEQPGIIIVCWSTFKNIWWIFKSFNVSLNNIKHGCKLYDVIVLHDSSNSVPCL